MSGDAMVESASPVGNEAAVIATDLRRSYGSVEALRGVSFSVGYGEIFGLIGPDGAGKTSIFRILTTLLLPASGSASVCGFDVVKQFRNIRETVGYMPGRFSLYQDLSVEENLDFFATLFGTSVKENYQLISDIYIQLEPFKKRKAAALSGGMKQKLALCCALIHKPKVLFLDEPTTGVDPVSRKEFWTMLGRLKKEGLAIVVSTPYMDEATLCDRIALIQDGLFLDIDTPAGVISKFSRTILSVVGESMPELLKLLRGHPSVDSCFAFGDRHHVVIKEGVDAPSAILSLGSYLESLGFQGTRITSSEPTIEDCFMLLSSRRKKGVGDDR